MLPRRNQRDGPVQRQLIGRPLRLVSALGFEQNECEVASAEGESLLDVPNHCDFSAAARNVEFLAEHPQGSGPVIDLKDAGSHRSKRISDPSGDRDFFAGESAGILVNLGDALARRTSCQQYAGKAQQQRAQYPVLNARHAVPQNARKDGCRQL